MEEERLRMYLRVIEGRGISALGWRAWDSSSAAFSASNVGCEIGKQQRLKEMRRKLLRRSDWESY